MDREPLPVVLVVDDVPTNIKVLTSALRHEYQIRIAINGEEALERAQQLPRPDLILLDVMMPGLDGYEVCRRLKNHPATRMIPVIFVTARDAEEDQQLGFRLGGVDYITKPFSIPLLQARVRIHVLLKQRTDALEKLSHIDSLTGIANRRQFDQALEREWKRAMREGHPLSLLMMDIDYFKPYNDHYGHGAGDDCLRQVATALAEGVQRPADLVARYGGEEFVVILPDTSSIPAREVAERLRDHVAQLQLPHAFSGAAPMVTISIGCTTTGRGGQFNSPEQLLQSADQMLYRAKSRGKNRVESCKDGLARDSDKSINDRRIFLDVFQQ